MGNNLHKLLRNLKAEILLLNKRIRNHILAGLSKTKQLLIRSRTDLKECPQNTQNLEEKTDL